MYVETPPGVRAKHLDVQIKATQLTIGIRGNPPFINEPFTQAINSSESTWTLEDGLLHLSLTKGSKGATWESLLKGHTPSDPFTQSEVQKSLMLERFQAEVSIACPGCPRALRRRSASHRSPIAHRCAQNPGFDFSGANFNGNVPDPKTFMGGVGYNQ